LQDFQLVERGLQNDQAAYSHRVIEMSSHISSKIRAARPAKKTKTDFRQGEKMKDLVSDSDSDHMLETQLVRDHVKLMS